MNDGLRPLLKVGNSRARIVLPGVACIMDRHFYGIYEGRWTAGPAPNPSAIFASTSLHESVPGSATPDSLRAVPNTLRSSNFLTGLSGCERIVVRNDDLLSVRRELLSVKGNVSARWALRWRTEGPSSPPAPVPSVRLRKPRLPSRGFSLSRSVGRWPATDCPLAENWPGCSCRALRFGKTNARPPSGFSLNIAGKYRPTLRLRALRPDVPPLRLWRPVQHLRRHRGYR
jgi:hypothetical protein